ncbi:hypothetical protein LZ659_20025, partial [Shewanella indica]|nr:hypothetical protein [Shewanella indica]
MRLSDIHTASIDSEGRTFQKLGHKFQWKICLVNNADDAYSGKNYDHRRGWVESLLFELEAVFAIDVAAFAIMSNHLHLVLHID